MYTRACVVLMPVVLTGCISTSTIDVPTQEPAVIHDRAIVDGQALPLPDEPTLKSESVDGPRAASPVVSKLLASSQQQRRTGQWDAASESLERALRIEPRNASLWAALAEVKYSQRDYNSAIQLSAKSNTLSGNQRQLRRRNWLLMANSYDALGNAEAATRFREKLLETAADGQY